MDNTELKSRFGDIQCIFNRCIGHAYRVLVDGFAAKSVRPDEDPGRKEYLRVEDELAQIYLHHSALYDLRTYFGDPDFFWKSGIYEALSSEKKKRYLSFPAVSFDYARYERDNMSYDDELPCFSVIVRCAVLEKYAAYLREIRVDKCAAGADCLPDVSSPESGVPAMAVADDPFEAALTDAQFALLTECINESRMFNALLTSEDLRALFACRPRTLLRSGNNRLVAYFFAGLSDRGLITSNWQSVIANYKLFLSRDKRRDKYINQSDLSSATNAIRDVYASGKYAIIDKYLKQVKKL